MINVQLLLIDPQNDFCDPENGSLFVPSANHDMDRLATMIKRLKHKINEIHVSLDTHHQLDIAHAIWFVDKDGNHPAPFTQISADDFHSGRWTTTSPQMRKYTLSYLLDLEASGRYPHVIWPNHCVIGTQGHSIYPKINKALLEWTNDLKWINYVFKGKNPHTEHFSAIRAQVPDPQDPETQDNVELIRRLQKADVIAVAGEASSHCVANTCLDIKNTWPELASKMVLLKDATSPVSGFEHLETKFIEEMTASGMKTSTTEEFLKDL